MFEERTAKQNHTRDSSKNLQFLCHEGFSIFCMEFKEKKSNICQYLKK